MTYFGGALWPKMSTGMLGWLIMGGAGRIFSPLGKE
jgi:hypothetical protein